MDIFVYFHLKCSSLPRLQRAYLFQKDIVMSRSLLPSSARAFAPRSTTRVLLKTQVSPWLTGILERTNQNKISRRDSSRQANCLVNLLSSNSAIWTLCTIYLRSDPNPMPQGKEIPLANSCQMIRIKAYVVYVDMVSKDEISFKLTPDTIDALVSFHQNFFLVNANAILSSWPERKIQLRKLQEDFARVAK